MLSSLPMKVSCRSQPDGFAMNFLALGLMKDFIYLRAAEYFASLGMSVMGRSVAGFWLFACWPFALGYRNVIVQRPYAAIFPADEVVVLLDGYPKQKTAIKSQLNQQITIATSKFHLPRSTTLLEASKGPISITE